MAQFGFVTAPEDLEPPLRLDGVQFRQVALRSPFCAAPPLADEWRLYVVRGDGVRLDTTTAAQDLGLLERGAVIGISGRTPHGFSSAGSRQGVRPGGGWAETPLGSKTAADESVIALSRIPRSSMPFLSLLGGFIRIDPDGQHGDVAARIGAVVDLIAQETARNDPMATDIILRLAEIIGFEMRRVGRASSALFDERSRQADYDPRIWRTIAAISSEPQRRWTVETMAEVAGMSRSAFAARYHETVGQTPMRSLRRLRMHRAAIALAAPGPRAIAPLADAMGYGSDAAFNRAFAKEYGHPPKRYGLKTACRAQDRSGA